MKTITQFQSAAAALIVLCLAASPAMADCPSLPDGPDSANVTNTQQRALCLQQQIQSNTLDRNQQLQIDNTQTTLNQLQIERRFDNLPRIGQRPSWER
ncbi:hypothetical protein [uncultured Devosia sp.]|uniref:hypothetical protein n=1 Tax=uncultured Devosia sp. TaxID=211434 RepID=UPI0035CC9C09